MAVEPLPIEPLPVEPLLVVEGLNVRFSTPSGPVDVVRGLGFELGRERLAIVGESGSGKSMTVRALLGLAAPAIVTARQARFLGYDLLSLSPRALRAIRGRRIGMIVQDSRQGLNPVKTVEHQVAEMLRLHRGLSQREARRRVPELLDEVHIADPRRVAGLHPHEVSGGMAQRIMIAMMLAGEPEVLIADESTSALDAVVQHGILELIDEQVRLRGMGLILISHDLDLVAGYADRVLVMYGGQVLETLASEQGYDAARHPYTRGLLACRPSLVHPGGRLPVLARDPAWLQ